MASLSSSSHYAPVSSSQPYKYDVFLSFRGEDTRKTFVGHLYSALKRHLISIYKDDESLPRGESIRPSLFKAIEESRTAVIIFSENYAESSWCLDELAHIMKCRDERRQIVMPIFYGVDPSEVRSQKRKFGEAFAKQEAKNVTKAELWRNALVDASNIAGWEPKHIANGNESKLIIEIVDTILNTLSPLNSDVDEDLVGMTTRLLDFKSCLEIGSGGVHMVGVWGVGGGGKTTLVSSLYMAISCYFESHHILENISEESNKYGLKQVQENLLSALFKTKVEVQSIVEGKHMIKSMLCRRNVLIILDDVSNLDQLEALAGSHKWFGSGSRILITTRDEHLLRTHKVDHVYSVTLLSDEEAIQLFNRHAYNEKDLVEDYDTLSLSVISYAAGLPLALKVLGSFLYDKEKKGWISTLARLKDIPEMEIVEKLKISYDGLKTIEKELFLDIACFWRMKMKDDAMEIFEACGFHPEIGIEVLRQKTLISIVDGRFDMHDLVQEMGHYIVRGEHPKSPEKHSRVWKNEEISNMCFAEATMVNGNIEAIRYGGYSYEQDLKHVNSSRFCMSVSNMKKLRWLSVSCEYDEWSFIPSLKYIEGPIFLSNELRYIDWEEYPASPFPDSFQPMKLVVLKLFKSKQIELWKGCKHLPHLKVLQLIGMNLLSTPDFDGPCLQKMTLEDCFMLGEIHPSIRNHSNLEYVSVSKCPKLRMFPPIVHMENLKTLEIKACNLKDGEIPSNIGEFSNLQELNLSKNLFSHLDVSLSQLPRLKLLNLSGCHMLLELPELPSSLVFLKADFCISLTVGVDCHKNCKWLCQVSLMQGSIINNSTKLLQSMLEGKAIENDCMLLLRLQGLQVAKGFIPDLRDRSRCKLQLPENWCNDFCGFLMCFVSSRRQYYRSSYVRILIKETSGMYSQENGAFKESDNDGYYNYVTRVWYVSFASLRHTTWWNHTHRTLLFDNGEKKCRGFGVKLVEKKGTSGVTKTSTNSSSDYTPKLKIVQDSMSALVICVPHNIEEIRTTSHNNSGVFCSEDLKET